MGARAARAAQGKEGKGKGKKDARAEAKAKPPLPGTPGGRKRLREVTGAQATQGVPSCVADSASLYPSPGEGCKIPTPPLSPSGQNADQWLRNILFLDIFAGEGV